eukprot:gene3543-4465_t
MDATKSRGKKRVSVKFGDLDDATDDAQTSCIAIPAIAPHPRWKPLGRVILNSPHLEGVPKGTLGVVKSVSPAVDGSGFDYTVLFSTCKPPDTLVEVERARVPEGWIAPPGTYVSSTSVEVCSLREVLQHTSQLHVPLFQRTYCWTPDLWARLWGNVLGDHKENQATHNLGRLMLWSPPPLASEHLLKPSESTKLMVVDGQQRITTCLLLLAALRDAARLAGCPSIAVEMDELLFSRPGLSCGERSGAEPGELLIESAENAVPTQKITRFSPTYYDRVSFCAAMGLWAGKLAEESPSEAQQALLKEGAHSARTLEAKRFFDERIAEYLAHAAASGHAALTVLADLARCATENLVFVHFKVDGEFTIQDVFERMALRDKNTGKAGGVSLSPVDLIRNHVLEGFKTDEMKCQ